MCRLDIADRQAVEAIREARTVRIIINEGAEDERSFEFDQTRGDFNHFRHELRLTTQDYINQCYLERKRMQLRNWMEGGLANKSARR
jgi:hypothetical protein